MHTATRLALPVIERVRALNPAARLCAFGLYAPLNAALLRELGVADVLGAEFEDDLRLLASDGARIDRSAPSRQRSAHLRPVVPRVDFRVPDRAALPALARYAHAADRTATRRVAGYTEASRGCKHRCRHCPIVPVYDGRFRVVPADIVLADVRAQVAAGARHITFGDPDFFNGIRHAEAVVRALPRRVPGASRTTSPSRSSTCSRTPRCCRSCAATGCAFVTSAVEVGGRRGAGAAGEGAHPRRLRARGGAVPRGRADAGADVRRVHAVDDARGLLRAAAGDRQARAGRAGRADPAGDPPARHRRLAAARAAGDAARWRRRSTPRP